MENFTELFKITSTREKFTKSVDTGTVGRDVESIQDLAGVEGTSYSIESYPSRCLHVDITYDPELTDRTKIANELEEYDYFEDVVLG